MRSANVNDVYVDKIRSDKLPDVVSNILLFEQTPLTGCFNECLDSIIDSFLRD